MGEYGQIVVTKHIDGVNPWMYHVEVMIMNPLPGGGDIKADWSLDIPTIFRVLPGMCERQGTAFLNANSACERVARFVLDLLNLPEHSRVALIEASPLVLRLNRITVGGVQVDEVSVRKTLV